MSVTELHADEEPRAGETYAEGLARAEKQRAEAEALRIRNEGERVRQELAAEKARARAAKDIQKDVDDAEDERRRRAEARRAEQEAKQRAGKSAATWRKAAKTIAVVCVLVSLPLQVMAFWDPRAFFLVAAPFVLEGVAWALLCGAQAAIDDDRPSWHYRLGALTQALIAAGINYAHGSAVFGAATGIGGALCSVIGPMIWDLHEHGRIAKRTGRKPYAVRRREAREAKAERKRVAKVNEQREAREPQVWERACDLAAAVGELVPSEKTFRRAWSEVHGTNDVGSTAARIAHARATKREVRVALNGPMKGPGVGEESQVDSQIPPEDDKPAKPRSKAEKKPGEDGRKRNGGQPPVRRPGTVQYSAGARRQMSLTAGRKSA